MGLLPGLFLLLLLIPFTTATKSTTATSTKSTTSSSNVDDTECKKQVMELQQQLERVRREVEGLSKDKVKLEDEIKLLTKGILEEAEAKDSAVQTMHNLFKEIVILQDELERKNEETWNMMNYQHCVR